MTRLLLATSLVLAACASDAPQEVVSGEMPERPQVLGMSEVRHDFTPAPTTTTTHYHPPTTTTAVPVMSNISPTTVPQTNSTNCGGWEGLVAAYFPAEQVATGCRILMCESNGNPNAVSPTNDHGLWQINAVHRNSFDWSRRYDPNVNTAFARQLWGEQGWSPWSCY